VGAGAARDAHAALSAGDLEDGAGAVFRLQRFGTPPGAVDYAERAGVVDEDGEGSGAFALRCSVEDPLRVVEEAHDLLIGREGRILSRR